MNENNLKSMGPVSRSKEFKPLIDLDQIWSLIVVNWKWFVVSVVTLFVALGLYLWFTPATVSVAGKMEIIEKSQKSSGMSAGLAMLSSLPMGLGNIGSSIGGSLGVDSEKEILTANSLVRDVVLELGVYTEYRLSKWGREKLLYQDQPINVTLDPAHVEWLDAELPLTVRRIKLSISKDDNGYEVETILKANTEKTYLPDQTFASLPATIKTEAGIITITENKSITEKQAKKYSDGYTLNVDINPPMESAEAFIKNLKIDAPSKKVTNMVSINLTDENVMRGIDFVNHLVEAYNMRANNDKNEEAQKTDAFVNARLAKLDSELGSSDAAWENSKKNFQITNPEVDAEEVMTKKSLYEGQLVEIGTELQLHDYLSEYVHNPDNLYELIPVGISGGMGNLSGDANSKESLSSNASLIAQHNTLVSQRKELLRSMSEKAPQIQRLTESIKELHPTLVTAMKRDRQNIIMKRNAVEREYSKYMGRINTAPKMERVLTEIGRQREIKQGVYLLMLQKREETAMELANVADRGKLIETTSFVKGSKKPQTKMVLLVGIFVGLLLPIIILYIVNVLKHSIETRKDVGLITKSPIVGEISLSNQSEDIRNLRTNLLLNIEEGQKVILFVSDSEGDGKTYLAKQLADSLSAIGKKTLYLDYDLRSKSSNVHPADVLASRSFAEEMAQAKADNNYVIIDTPALNQYNDAYQIAQYTDVTCYVVKVGTTPKSVIQNLEKESRLSNIKLILNAIDMTKKKYKYYYKHALTMISFSLLFTACGSTGKVAYIQNPDKVNLESSKVLFDARIMPKDLLTITVSTVNPEAAVPFNLTAPTAMTQENLSLTSQPTLQTYLVSNDGTIEFPIIGSISVGGLTKTECESMILEKIRPYLAETEKPIVTVRMSSYSIAVLGEVKNPGSFQVTREKINIFEALAQAGDMTIYGVRDRVRLIREDASGKKEIHVLDLSDANIINSPYYYLQQNDIVYVEPSNIKKQDARVGSMTNLWFSATSILVSVASLLVNILR